MFLPVAFFIVIFVQDQFDHWNLSVETLLEFLVSKGDTAVQLSGRRNCKYREYSWNRITVIHLCLARPGFVSPFPVAIKALKALSKVFKHAYALTDLRHSYDYQVKTWNLLF